MRSLLASLALAMTAHAQPIDLGRMIEAIAQVEGGSWTDAGGACQISYAAWSDNCKFSYQLSRTKDFAIPVYESHLRWIIAQLRRHGAKVTPEAVALCWRWGFEGARAMRFRGEYGTRCQNLYESLAKP